MEKLTNKNKELNKEKRKLSNRKRNKIIIIFLLTIAIVVALVFTIKSSELKDMIQVYVSTYGLISIIILTFILENLNLSKSNSFSKNLFIMLYTTIRFKCFLII